MRGRGRADTHVGRIAVSTSIRRRFIPRVDLSEGGERDLWIILEDLIFLEKERSLDYSRELDLFRGGKIFGSF